MDNQRKIMSKKKSNRFIELIAYHKNHKLQYQGKCKIYVNLISEQLIIQPTNKEHKTTEATFKWHFVRKKNVLLVFASDELKDFVLAFSTEKRCSKVYNCICKKTITTTSTKVSVLENRLLLPLFLSAADNDVSNRQIKSIIWKWFNSNKVEAKENFLRLMKDNGVDNIGVNEKRRNNVVANVLQNKNSNNSLKRKHSVACHINETVNTDMTDNGWASDGSNENRVPCKRRKSSERNEYSNTVSNAMFKYIVLKQVRCRRRRLAIFNTPAKTHYYPYHRNQHNDLYVCTGCREKNHYTTAIFDIGNNMVKLDNKSHVCEPEVYAPEKYYEIKILRKGDYKICENLDPKIMLVYYDKEKILSYQYNWQNAMQRFVCSGCRFLNKHLFANICYTEADNEYIEMIDHDHICEPKKYDPEKYNQCNEFLLKPNFEVRITNKNGKEQPTLIVFNKDDRRLCYVYHKQEENTFACSGCNKAKKCVYVKLCRNDDDEEYVILSKVQHICLPRHYVPQTEEIIIQQPNFEYLEKTSTGAPKLFIFDNHDKSKSYVFSKQSGKNATNKFYCYGCHRLPKTKTIKQINGVEVKGVVKAYLCKDDSTNDYYVRMAAQKHLCKPKKHKPEQFEIKNIAVTEFILFRPKADPQKLRVAFYHPDNKNICYVLNYFSSLKQFLCRACKEKKKYIAAKLKVDDAGKEYFIHDISKHICKPVKVSAIKQPKNKILEKTGLGLEKKKIDESKLIRKPNFEFRGVPENNLIIFKKGDKSLCYEYCKSSEYYKCIKCKTATAKVNVDENGESYVILGRNEHKCEPIKYQSEDKNIIKAGNFHIFNRNFLNRQEALVIFTSSNKELCYEMDYYLSSKNFRCLSCTKLKKCVSAKICKNPAGEDYVHLLREHICQAKKFNPQAYKPIIIPAEGFQYIKNDEGVPKLNVYTTDKKNTIFEFELLKDNIFLCARCKERGRQIHAVLREEDGKKFLEVPAKRHTCIFNSNNLIQKNVHESDDDRSQGNDNIKDEKNQRGNNSSIYVKSENFKLFEYKRQGSLVQKLIIFENDERKMCHIYINDKENCVFECCLCRDNYKIKLFTAMLKIENNGKQFVEVENGHSCPLRKYNPEKFKERKCIYKPDYKVIEGIEDGLKKKKLIIFDAANKELCYEYSQQNKYKNDLTFECSGCRIKAKIFHEKTPTEYLELYSDEHVCDLRPYDPDSLFKETNYIYEPDYEIQTVKKDGKDLKRLILFDKQDKNYCFEYTYRWPFFTCCKCKKYDHGVYATLVKDKNGKECIKLNSRKHICEPKLYVPEEDKQEVSIEITNFEIVPSFKNPNTKNLILFNDVNKKLCYEFYPSGDRYYCRGCTKTPTKYYNIKFAEDENGKFFMTMKAGQKHGCKPLKYDSSKFKLTVKTVKASNFVFYKKVDNKFGLIIYASQDKQLCYNYSYRPAEKTFHCSECSKARKKLRATVHLNIDGEEYVKLGATEHVCKPLKFSSIKSSIFKYVKATDILTPKPEHQGDVIKDFELRDGKDGSKDAVLIAFDANDKSLCYILNYRKSSKTYACNNCFCKGACVSAKRHSDETGRIYFVMGENGHVCKPVEYEPEKEKFRNYIITEKNAGNPMKKLIVFTNEERTHCYEYLICSRGTKCLECKDDNVTAKLMKDKEGLEYVEFGKQEHSCSPLIYDPTKYENGTIIPSSQFVVFPNTQGTMDKRLIIFDGNDYNLGYEYNTKYKIFNCMKCNSKMKNTTNAKLITNVNNGEKYVEHFKTEHICEVQNLHESGRIIYSSNYKLEGTNEDDQMLTATHHSNATKCYKFQYSNEFQAFYCLGCRERNKVIAGKLCKKNDESHFFVLAFDHFCKPLSHK